MVVVGRTEDDDCVPDGDWVGGWKETTGKMLKDTGQKKTNPTGKSLLPLHGGYELQSLEQGLKEKAAALGFQLTGCCLLGSPGPCSLQKCKKKIRTCQVLDASGPTRCWRFLDVFCSYKTILRIHA